ncbi:GumC family protein [Acidisarcina polymorpha]|nr:polysaccharide biosynthesis tyrosine autokinase [Acidisarcina polymorpha]
MVSCVGGCVALAVLVCVFCTRRYQAFGEIQVQKDSSDALGLDSMMGGAEDASDALDANITLQTQADLLESDTLALQVIEALELETTRDYQPRYDALGSIFRLLSPSGPADPLNASLENSPRRRTRALKIFDANLNVKVVSGTRLIEVRFLSSDPVLAAKVVNQLMDGLVEYNFQTRFTATNQASEWLTGQLSDLKKQAEALQARVIALQRQSGVVSLGVQDAQGRDQAYSVIVDRLQQATATLSQATSNRILKGAVYKIVQSGNAELISGLSANGIVSGSPTLSTSLGLIQSLRMQEAALQGQIAQDTSKFGPSYPRLMDSRANLSGMESAIEDEVHRVAERSKNDYEIARREEDESRTEFATEKHQADSLNDKAIEYAIVRQEADDSRGLYEDLLKRLKEAGVLEGLRSSNITVVDPGRIPSTPKQPNIPVYLAIAAGVGLFLGVCGAFISDSIDDKIQTIEEIERDLELVPLGILPHLGEPNWYRRPGGPSLSRARSPSSGVNSLAIFAHPNSPYTEALRGLRTALLLAKSSAPPQLLLITSSVAGEGKSILSANLAAVLAQSGRRVLLVDADLRKPSLGDRLGMESRTGLSQYLTDERSPEDILEVGRLPKLHLLTSGPVPPYPADLLGSLRMMEALDRWRGYYDFIVLDSPPVLLVTDPVVLASLADATLLVARYGMTNRLSLARSHRTLMDQSTQDRVGIVLNGVSQGSPFHYEYYGHSGSLGYPEIHGGKHVDA